MSKILIYKEGAFSTIVLDSGERVMLTRLEETYTLCELKLMGILPGRVLHRWEVARFALEIIDGIAMEIRGDSHFKKMVDEVARYASVKELVDAFNAANRSGQG